MLRNAHVEASQISLPGVPDAQLMLTPKHCPAVPGQPHPSPLVTKNPKIHTNTSGSHIGGDHNRRLAASEFTQHPVSLVLVLVTVNGQSRPAVLSQKRRNVVTSSLCRRKDKTLGLLVGGGGLQVLDQTVSLLKLSDNLHKLGDGVRGSQFQGANGDLNWVNQVVSGQVLDFLWPGSRPHQGLTVWSDLVDNLSNLRLETHIQHSVGLIQHQVSDSSEVRLLGLQHVNQTTWCGDTNLDTASQVSDLLALGGTTIDTGVSDSGRGTELGALLLNLNSQFSGGGQDQHDRTVTVLQKRLSVDVHDSWQTVRQGLTGTSGGDTHHVSTGQSHGPTLTLNGSGLRETLLLDLAEHIVWEASLVERGDRLGNVWTLNGHVILLSKGLNIGVGTGSHLGVLGVEVLLKLWQGVEIPLRSGKLFSFHRGSVESTTTTTVATTASAVATATRSVVVPVIVVVVTGVVVAVTAVVGHLKS